MSQDAKEALRHFWNACGLPETAWPEALERYQRYWGLIQTHNEPAGLMGRVSPEDFYLKHLVDSLSILAAYPGLIDRGPQTRGIAFGDPAPCRLVDVGSGAGLPGIVLAVALPQLQLAAVESNHKKSRFVATAIESLGLAARAAVINRRSRDLGHDRNFAGQFDVVTARAVASADKLIRDCRLLLAAGGSAILYKTPAAVAEEFPLARREAAKHKLTVETSAVIDLPAGAGTRQFIRIRAA